MAKRYGPWATSINAYGSPQLNTFWRRRLKMLVSASQTSPVLSRQNVLWLGAAAVLMSALPMLYSPSAAAEEKEPARISKETRPNGEQEKSGPAAQAARCAYEAALKDYYANRAEIEAVYRWSCRWMQAEGVDRRATAMQSHLDRMQTLCDQVTKLHKSGGKGGEEANVAAARYYLLEAKDMLKRTTGLSRGVGRQTAKDLGAKPAEAAKTAATPRHDKEIAAWQRETWQMRVDLDAPRLEPPAVQYAIFDHNPLAAFRAHIKKMHAYNRERIEKAETAELKKIHRESSMTVAWDSEFRDVTGDKLYLLISAPFTTQTMSSNGPDGKKWIVTKTVQIKGKPVCWCLPVEVKRGESVHVTLTEENAFDLEAAYDKAMKAVEQAKGEPKDAQ